jgi:hypothetical protein
MSDPRDLSGVWYGSYAADQYDEASGFIALFEEISGSFTGTITEPDAGGVRRASVDGVREGATLSFVKRYDGSGGWTHAVRYAGHVDGEGTQVAGSWTLQGWTGSFTMEREKFDAVELEREEEIARPVPVR